MVERKLAYHVAVFTYGDEMGIKAFPVGNFPDIQYLVYPEYIVFPLEAENLYFQVMEVCYNFHGLKYFVLCIHNIW